MLFPSSSFSFSPNLRNFLYGSYLVYSIHIKVLSIQFHIGQSPISGEHFLNLFFKEEKIPFTISHFLIVTYTICSCQWHRYSRLRVSKDTFCRKITLFEPKITQYYFFCSDKLLFLNIFNKISDSITSYTITINYFFFATSCTHVIYERV